MDLSLPSSSLSLNNIERTFKSFILPILDFSLYLLIRTVLSFLGLPSVSEPGSVQVFSESFVLASVGRAGT